MIKNKKFCVIGGDMRQAFMAKSISEDKNEVKLCGIKVQEPELKNLCCDSIDSAIKNSKYVILPLPVTRDGYLLNAPFSDFDIKLDDNFADKLQDKVAFCGISKVLEEKGDKWRNLKLRDYYKREEFEILNAVPTAEGAIQVAMEEFKRSVFLSKCLVVGYGRIGKVLARLLKNMGADVTVSARKTSDLAWIKVMGYDSINTESMPGNLEYDLIFNTVPYKIFDKNNLSKCDKKSIIIDLASNPGGVDFEKAEALGIKAIHALGLPGKFAPVTAGNIIKEVIYNMLEEEKP